MIGKEAGSGGFPCLYFIRYTKSKKLPPENEKILKNFFKLLFGVGIIKREQIKTKDTAMCGADLWRQLESNQ